MSELKTLMARLSPVWLRSLALLLLLQAAVLLIYRDTAEAMVLIWMRSETFAHAFVVPPIALWLIWRQRDAVLRLAPRAWPWALPLMGLAAVVWAVGDLAFVNPVMQLALIAMLVLAVPAVLGTAVTYRILFPLGFLFFAAPVGEFMTPKLIEWTADFTISALRLSGVPVFREGMQFVIPTGSWSVVEACSGIRYLIASLMVGTLFAYLNYTSMRRRWIFVGISILVPLVANWLRAYMIVMLGHFSGNKLAVGADHLLYGWVFFGIVMILMFMIGARWAEDPVDDADKLDVGLAEASNTKPAQASWLPAATVVAGVLLVLAPGIGLRVSDGTMPKGTPEIALSLDATAWQSSAPSPDLSEWAPSYQAPTASLQQAYVKAGQEVGVYVAYYHHQSSSSKLVSSVNTLVGDASPHWSQVATRGQELTLDGTPASLGINQSELARNVTSSLGADRRLIVWQLFWVDGQWTRSATRAKLLGAWSRLKGQGDDGASVMFFVRKVEPDTSTAVLSSFVRENLPLIEAQLRRARGQN